MKEVYVKIKQEVKHMTTEKANNTRKQDKTLGNNHISFMNKTEMDASAGVNSKLKGKLVVFILCIISPCIFGCNTHFIA